LGERDIQQICVGVSGTRLSLLLLFQENDVSKHYMELAAENRQQLSRLEFAKKIVEKVPAKSLWMVGVRWIAVGNSPSAAVTRQHQATLCTAAPP